MMNNLFCPRTCPVFWSPSRRPWHVQSSCHRVAAASWSCVCRWFLIRRPTPERALQGGVASQAAPATITWATSDQPAPSPRPSHRHPPSPSPPRPSLGGRRTKRTPWTVPGIVLGRGCLLHRVRPDTALTSITSAGGRTRSGHGGRATEGHSPWPRLTYQHTQNRPALIGSTTKRGKSIPSPSPYSVWIVIAIFARHHWWINNMFCHK